MAKVLLLIVLVTIVQLGYVTSETTRPTPRPTKSPIASPTKKPTMYPTFVPTSVPTSIPTPVPTITDYPTAAPTEIPTGGEKEKEMKEDGGNSKALPGGAIAGIFIAICVGLGFAANYYIGGEKKDSQHQPLDGTHVDESGEEVKTSELVNNPVRHDA